MCKLQRNWSGAGSEWFLLKDIDSGGQKLDICDGIAVGVRKLIRDQRNFLRFVRVCFVTYVVLSRKIPVLLFQTNPLQLSGIQWIMKSYVMLQLQINLFQSGTPSSFSSSMTSFNLWRMLSPELLPAKVKGPNRTLITFSAQYCKHNKY